jgi:hypothetical protein
MSTSHLSSQDIRAAAEVHQELGPDYSDAVMDSFLEKIEARLDERVDAHLAELAPARRPGLAGLSKDHRRGLQTGAMIGIGGIGVPVFLHMYSAITYVNNGDRNFWATLLVVSAGMCGAGFARLFRRER